MGPAHASEAQATLGRTREVLHAALIGPVPPAFGGATSGGVATHLVQLAEGLANAGVATHVLATNVQPRMPLQVPGCDCQVVPRPRGAMGWFRPSYLLAVGLGAMVSYAWRLRAAPSRTLGSRRAALAEVIGYRQFLVRTHPSLVHVQHPLERCDYVRLVLRYEQPLPLVVTAHSLFEEHDEQTIWYQMAPNLRAADRVIAVSPHVAEQATRLGVDPGRIRVIRSGVDAHHFRPGEPEAARRALGVNAYVPLVLFVGNLEPRKCVDRLIRAFPRVLAQVPGARLIVIGSGASAGAHDQQPVLRELVARLRLQESVRFLGRVSESELVQWYQAADVFALPSSSEAQGIVALEAMACGLPVVASAVGGLLGTIQDGQSGFLVPHGDEAMLANRLARVLSDAPLAAAFARQGLRVAREQFTWEQAVESTVGVYRELLES